MNRQSCNTHTQKNIRRKTFSLYHKNIFELSELVNKSVCGNRFIVRKQTKNQMVNKKKTLSSLLSNNFTDFVHKKNYTNLDNKSHEHVSTFIISGVKVS